MKNLDINAFVNSYLATASWVTIDDCSECSDFTREAKIKARKDCETFISRVVFVFGKDKAEELLTIPGNDLTYLAPHDFFLTRNGHGAGFWDSPNIYGEDESEGLTRISQEMRGADCYHVRGPKSKLTFN